MRINWIFGHLSHDPHGNPILHIAITFRQAAGKGHD